MPRAKIDQRSGVSLVEVLVAMIIVVISLALFKTVFLNNWTALESKLVRAGLWQSANEILTLMTDEGRAASRFVVARDEDTAAARMLDREGNTVITFTLTPEGIFQYARGDEEPVVMSERVEWDESDFELSDGGLRVRLCLREQVFLNEVDIRTATEILSRN